MNTFTNPPTAPVTPFAPVNHYLTVLTRYADFKGRSSRSEYWYFVLINMLVSFVLSFVFALVSPTVASIINGLYFLAILGPAIAVCVRRVHDVDKEWWYALIPLYNFILAITPGTPGPNQYGAAPASSAKMA